MAPPVGLFCKDSHGYVALQVPCSLRFGGSLLPFAAPDFPLSAPYAFRVAAMRHGKNEGRVRSAGRLRPLQIYVRL